VRVTVVYKHKAVVCCLLATSAIMISEKKKRRRKMWSKKQMLKFIYIYIYIIYIQGVPGGMCQTVSGSVCVGVPYQCGYGGVVSLCSPKHYCYELVASS